VTSYLGHPSGKGFMQTVWPMKVGDTYTTFVDGKVRIYRVENTGRGCFPPSHWVALQEIGGIPVSNTKRSD
jgi:hypothetical protein